MKRRKIVLPMSSTWAMLDSRPNNVGRSRICNKFEVTQLDWTVRTCGRIPLHWWVVRLVDSNVVLDGSIHVFSRQ
jgi:hypothetical protein